LARKVPKTVSLQFIRNLTVGQAIVVLSIMHLVDWYYFGVPVQSWVPVLAWGALVATIVFAIASRILPRLRGPFVILRSQFRALPPARQFRARMYAALMGICGFSGPELIWYVFPQGTDYNRPPSYELALFAFAVVEAALFRASLNSISRA
jgi:hypothetical protein